MPMSVFRDRFAASSARIASAMAPLYALVLAAPAVQPLAAQVPITSYADAFEARFTRTQPVVRYTIHVDPATDSLGYGVTMSVRGVRDTVRFAIPYWAPGAYREARFHRHIADVRVSIGTQSLPVTREDSITWRVVMPKEQQGQRELTLQYAVRYPTVAAARGMGNYSFFRPDGGLLSGPMTYMHLKGQTLVPAHVTFELPQGWTIATGLRPTVDPRTFFAPTYDVLIDCPILIGAKLRLWHFSVDGVPHRIAYYVIDTAVTFDEQKWVSMHEKIVTTSRDIMGRLPYRDYTFIYEDGPGGGLEHLNSATMAMPIRSLARDAAGRASLVAHEFFHAWNVKRIRPAELGPFAYDRPVRTTTLWWAEGVTDFFEAEILRRSGLYDENAAIQSFAGAIEAYLANPGHDQVSPERSSWTSWDANTVNRGYNISYYTTGGLLGELLELSLRHATGGTKGMDDVERLLFDRFAGERGYTSEDLLNTVNEVCGCDMQPFFERYVSGRARFDFNAALVHAGWQLETTTESKDSAGRPFPDLRAGITPFAGVGSLGRHVGSPARLSLSVPDGSFGRAGLVDGDFITAVNAKPVATPDDFRDAFRGAAVGDRFEVAYRRDGTERKTTVTILPYERVRARITDLPTVTPGQRQIRAIWLHGPRASAASDRSSNVSKSTAQ